MKKFQFLVDHSVLALQYVELLEQMELQARTDGLTGVANYRHFYERLEEEFSPCPPPQLPLEHSHD